ncbi:MAG: hypothetical protein H6Q01_652 [Acidobacteria bacterium]|nr:hypothetical protein [Acidobacteriota bacterium]
MSDHPERHPFAAPETDWSAARASVRERIRRQWPAAADAELLERTDDALVRLARRLRADLPPPIEEAMAAAAARSLLEQLRGRRRWSALRTLVAGAPSGAGKGSEPDPVGDPLERFRFLALSAIPRAEAGERARERLRLAIEGHPKPPIALPDAAPLDWPGLARRFARALAREPAFAPLVSWTARAAEPGVPADEIAAHAWFGARILPFLTGLLRPAEDALFREFGDRDAHCRLAFAPFAEGAGERADIDGHVPPPVLARWADAPQDLGPAESRAVREHLAACAECRDDLAALGLDVRALESGGTVPGRRPPRGRRREAALVAWAIAASLAAVVLGGQLLRSAIPTGVGDAGGGERVAVAAVEPVGTPHLVLSRTRRRPTPPPPPIELTGREPLYVRVPDLPAAVQSVFVELDDAAGRPLVRERLPVARVNAAFLLGVRPPAPWASGSYRLRVLAADGETPLLDGPLAIRVAGD